MTTVQSSFIIIISFWWIKKKGLRSAMMEYMQSRAAGDPRRAARWRGHFDLWPALSSWHPLSPVPAGHVARDYFFYVHLKGDIIVCVCARVYLYVLYTYVQRCVYIGRYIPRRAVLYRRVIMRIIYYGLMRKPCFIACLRVSHNMFVYAFTAIKKKNNNNHLSIGTCAPRSRLGYRCI